MRHEKVWARHDKQKKCKDSGKGYTTYQRKGKSVEKKQMTPVICQCTFNCATNMNIPEKCQIFKKFYKLSNHNTQNKYLFGFIRWATPRKRPQSASNPRNNSFYVIFI